MKVSDSSTENDLACIDKALGVGHTRFSQADAIGFIRKGVLFLWLYAYDDAMVNTSQRCLSNGGCMKRSQLSVAARMEEKAQGDCAPDQSIF
jgi:hypothetical protein